MKKALLVVILYVISVFASTSFAYSLNELHQIDEPSDTGDFLESFINSLLTIPNKITGLAITNNYKTSTKKEVFRVEQVECSTNKIRVLVKSESFSDRNLVYTLNTKVGTKKIFTQNKLETGKSSWFMLATNTTCNNLKTLKVNGYDAENGARSLLPNKFFQFSDVRNTIATTGDFRYFDPK